MTPQALQKYVDDKFALLRTPEAVPGSGRFDNLLGYWFLEVLTDQTLAGASDHTSTFEDTSEPRTSSLVCTMGGWFPAMIVGGSDRPCRLRIGIWNDGPPYEVDVTLDADTFGHVQVKVNGEFNDYTANQELTWKFRTGPNEISIIVADGAERVTFSGNLWDGFYAKWMPVNWSAFGGSGGATGIDSGGGGGGGGNPLPNNEVGV